MNKFALLLLSMPVLLLSSCSNGDYSSYSYDEETIFSASDKTLFSEIMFFLSPVVETDGQTHYVFADNLRNLAIEINGRSWTVDASERLDTLNLRGRQTEGIFRTTTDRINFPFVINVRPDMGNPETAGDYSGILNNYVTLPPGSYLCRIKSFDVPLRGGAFSTIYTPGLNMALEVKENTAATNLGDFVINVTK